MHCRTCGYTLWNLPQPICPECGNGFDLRTFRFKPHTVGFACPHCSHLHGGIGEKHVPTMCDQATCLGCGQTMRVTDMRVVLLVDDPALAEAADADVLPWEQRRLIGRWSAWWQTWKMSMVEPRSLAKRVTPSGGWVDSYRFAVWCSVIPNLIRAAIFMAIFTWAFYAMRNQSFGPGPTTGSSGASSASHAAPLGGFEWLFLLAIPFALALWVLIAPLLVSAFIAFPAHMFLWATGSKMSFTTTARSVFYAYGPLVFTFLSGFCCLGWFGRVWMLVSATQILATAHEAPWWRALAALLWFPALVIGVLMAVNEDARAAMIIMLTML